MANVHFSILQGERSGRPDYLHLPLAFYYESKQPVPKDEIVKSLLALEKLAAKVPLLLRELSGTRIGRHAKRPSTPAAISNGHSTSAKIASISVRFAPR